ncbi:acyl carrier protein [Marinomonas sp. TI.3.20]|uniref:acyl carrier protein n=1 Tax=Marinomonas sp. TI.3.20 TaxID=3121296 RepID=UPI00405357F0
MKNIIIETKSLIEFIKHDLLLGKELTTPLDADTDLINSNIIDSLSLIQLVTHLEREFEIKIDDSDINPDNFINVNSLSNFINSKIQTKK